MARLDLYAILSTLTLEEKISLLAGQNFWETTDIPGKGIPSVKVTDGPNGARGSTFKGGITSACFPAASSVASTFDIEIARQIGVALGEETLSKGARCLLGPTMCNHRHPLGGRNFESFSEDPFLSGKMAAQNVIGLESTGVAATIKHFVANEQETQRLSVNADIGQRALREIYLRPFEIAVKEGRPGAVMTAYNLVNGCHMDSHPLLTDVLRGEWGWDGLVISDWGGVNSTAESLIAGLDLEMPGPTRWRTPADVVSAIEEGKLTKATIDERAIRILRFLERQGCFKDLHEHGKTTSEERVVDRPEHRRLIRTAGAKGIVLLKNEKSILPLTKEKVEGKTIALLGYAKQALISGGGSASVNAHYTVTPFDALEDAFQTFDVELTYAKGAHTSRQLPLLSSLSENVVGLDGGGGFTCLVSEDEKLQLPSTTVHGLPSSNISFLDSVEGVSLTNTHVELIGFFTPAESTIYYFSLSGLGPSLLMIDDKVIYEQKGDCPDSMGFLFSSLVLPQLSVPLEAGRSYKIHAKTSPPQPPANSDEGLSILKGQVAVRLGCASSTVYDKDIVTEAVQLARAADIAIVFTGNDPVWETECVDQAAFSLPRDGSQDRLVTSVAAANSNTIVVNSTGVAVSMPWLDQVKGLLQAWFPGQEAGNSIADVLTGAHNPEGHLTCTLPKRLEDCPAHGNFPGDCVKGKLRVEYAEGVFVGYRHFDRLPRDMINFPFGFGLSYTTFAYSDLVVSRSDSDASSEYQVSVELFNTGSVSGATAVQLYVGSVSLSAADPIKGLAAFTKVRLDAGASTTVRMVVNARNFAFWSERDHKWLVKAGDYNFSIGRSAADLVVTSVVQVEGQSFHP